MNKLNFRVAFSVLGFFILSVGYAQDSDYEKFMKQSNAELAAFKKESDDELKTFLKGWDNDFFSIDELSEEKPNTEAIAVEVVSEETPNQSAVPAYLSMPPSATTGIKLWAVVIGVSKYALESNNLNYADDDAQRFARFLASPEGGAIPEDRLYMLIDEDATHEIAYATIQYVFEKAEDNDGIILYFSGHGSPSSFVLHDYGAKQLCKPDGTPIKNQGLLTHYFVNTQIAKSKAKYKYCIIDACHSASMTNTQTKTMAEMSELDSFYKELDKSNSGSVYILSSRAEEVSYENRSFKAGLRGGFFTYFLMDGIRGKADYNKDQIVTVVEAFDYCKRVVAEVTENKQNPAISGQYSRQMPIGVVRKSN